MYNKNPHIQFLLTALVLDVLDKNGATYEESFGILEMALSEIQESYNYHDKIPTKVFHNHMNTEYLQKMVNENARFLHKA